MYGENVLDVLVDNYGRVVRNIRISVTNRCNLRCFYCHREGVKGSEKEISGERIAEIAWAFYKCGVRKVKLTGGEPLLRKDIPEIIQNLPPFREVSMTTNGILLADKAYELKECGLDRVNVSLDTLDAEKYRKITGGDVSKVTDGIHAACDAGLTPIKVNMILMKGINEDEIREVLDFTNSFNKGGVRAILQLIELLPLHGLEKYYIDISKFEKEFSLMAFKVKLRSMHRRKQYWTPIGVVEFVKPVHNPEFCMNCDRIRVTSDGKIKLCLLRDDVVCIDGKHGAELIDAIKHAVKLREPYHKTNLHQKEVVE